MKRRTQRRRRRDDRGLTTLEWLLIVATVAGLAALAVGLVTNVVTSTADEIAGQSARKSAAVIAGDDITDRANVTDIESGLSDDEKAARLAELNAEWKRRCERLRVTFSDVDDLSVTWGYFVSSGSDLVFTPGDVPNANAWDLRPRGPTCRVE